MDTDSQFYEKRYRQEAEGYNECAADRTREKHAKTWLEKDTVDSWRHTRMYDSLVPLLKAEDSARWLTVGDGRYGRDAKYIIDNGGRAIATDISDVLLKEAKEMGYINDYRKENAESLSFADSEFDYVFCKESYHHFPRPALALYEMLRVASKGVVLIEPNDPYVNDTFVEVFFRNLKNGIKKALGKPIHKHGFEEVGNYIFSISRREMEKIGIGLNCTTVAFKGLNDEYSKGVEYEKISDNGPLFKKVRRKIFFNNLLCEIGLKDYSLLVAIIFKKTPTINLMQGLAKAKYEIIELPENPYLEK